MREAFFFFFEGGMFIKWGRKGSPGHVPEHLIDSEMDQLLA